MASAMDLMFLLSTFDIIYYLDGKSGEILSNLCSKIIRLIILRKYKRTIYECFCNECDKSIYDLTYAKVVLNYGIFMSRDNNIRTFETMFMDNGLFCSIECAVAFTNRMPCLEYRLFIAEIDTNRIVPRMISYEYSTDIIRYTLYKENAWFFVIFKENIFNYEDFEFILFYDNVVLVMEILGESDNNALKNLIYPGIEAGYIENVMNNREITTYYCNVYYRNFGANFIRIYFEMNDELFNVIYHITNVQHIIYFDHYFNNDNQQLLTHNLFNDI